jgi:serine/threonine-protein kinase HipA
MKLGSKYKFTQVEARHWEQFAEAAGLSKAQTKERVPRIAEYFPIVARQLKASPPCLGQPLSAQIVALIEQRSALTMRRLLEGGNKVN